MKSFAGIAVLCVVAASAVAQSNSVAPHSGIDAEHTKWIASAMTSMQSIKGGMTRTDLLTVFAEEGGLSTPSQRTYVYQQCPYIKVDVKFAAASPSEEQPTDKIIQISQPYLAWTVAD
jgi:hypothetical protein